MAVFTLRTLGLRGVAVVCDGQNVGLRLGVECQPAISTPEVRINPRHPSHNPLASVPPAWRLDDHAEYDRMAAMAATGAGRSLRCDGVHSRPTGTLQSPAAKRLSKQGRQAADRSAASPARLLALSTKGFTAFGAAKTRSASTWAS